MTRAIAATATLLVALGTAALQVIGDARNEADVHAARADAEAARADAAETRAVAVEARAAETLAGIDAERAGAAEHVNTEQLTALQRTEEQLQQAAEELQMCSAQLLVALEELDDEKRRRRKAERQ